jgi:hypothetical protein
MSDLLDPKKNFVALGKLAVVVVAVLIGLFVLYNMLGQEGKDTINELGLGKQVIPWVDRADTMSRNLIELNKDKIAAAIQGISHPTGKEPHMESYRVSRLNERILTEFTILWKGGFLGTDYITQVSWEFSKRQHENAKVIFDSAPTNVSQENAEMLNDYFRTKIYPVLLEDMGA